MALKYLRAIGPDGKPSEALVAVGRMNALERARFYAGFKGGPIGFGVRSPPEGPTAGKEASAEPGQEALPRSQEPSEVQASRPRPKSSGRSGKGR